MDEATLKIVAGIRTWQSDVADMMNCPNTNTRSIIGRQLIDDMTKMIRVLTGKT